MRLPVTLSLLLFTALYLSSYSSGPARNGVDGTSSGLADSRKCGSCHSGGDFGNQTTFALIDGAGQTQMAYRPGETYKVQVKIATSRAPGGYGFQLLMIDGQKSQAGTFGTLPANTRLSGLNGRNYLEHNRRLSAGTIEVDWTAPAKGTGTLNVYAVGNAVNGDGGQNGDQTNEASVTLAESTASAVGEQAWPAGITVAQASGSIIVGDGRGFGESPLELHLYDMSGRLVSAKVLAKAEAVMGGLTAGVHLLQLGDTGGVRAARLVVVWP